MPMADLASALASCFDPGLPGFVLIDPMLGEPIAVELADTTDISSVDAARETAWARNVYRLRLEDSIELPLHQHPYLVALQSATDAWLTETLRLAEEERCLALAGGIAGNGCAAHRIGGWIQSDANPQKIAESLAVLMRVNTSARTTARYQRLADRRVLGWLRHVAARALGRAAFTHLQSWHYLDAFGQLAQLERPEDVSGTPSLRLSQSEWTEFVRGDLVHPAISRWLGAIDTRQHGPWTAASVLEGAVDNAIAAYRRAAQSIELVQPAIQKWPQRFKSASDRTAWLALTLLHGDIGHRIEVKAVLDAPPTPDEPPETIEMLSAQLDAICLKAAP